MTIVSIVIDDFGTVTKGLFKGQEDLEVGARDHPNYCTIENFQNTEKSPEDLRKLAVTQAPEEAHKLKLMWKTLNEEIVIIITIVIVNLKLIVVWMVYVIWKT